MSTLSSFTRLLRGSSASDALTSTYRFTEAVVRVASLAGTVTVEPHTGEEVEVRVTRAGEGAKALTVRSEVIKGEAVLIVSTAERAITFTGIGVHSSIDVPLTRDGRFSRLSSAIAQPITVMGRAGAPEAHADIVILVPAGRRLSVALGAGMIRLGDVQADVRAESCAAELRSRGVHGALDARSESGDLKIRQHRGDLEVHTVTGDISFYDTQSEQVIATSDEGTIRGALLHTASVMMRADHGTLSLEHVKAQIISLETNAGDMDLAISSDVSEMALKAKLGSISLSMPTTMNVTVTAQSPFGSVSPDDCPFVECHTTQTGLTGTMGTGAGKVYVEAIAGDVTLRAFVQDLDE